MLYLYCGRFRQKYSSKLHEYFKVRLSLDVFCNEKICKLWGAKGIIVLKVDPYLINANSIDVFFLFLKQHIL